jgi:hypothetical protein
MAHRPTASISRWARFACAVLLLAALSAGASGAGPKQIVAEYLRRDAAGGLTSTQGFDAMSHLLAWRDGPGWDSAVVVRSSRIVSSQRAGRSAKVVVEYAVAGMLHGLAFKPGAHVERVEFEVVRSSEIAERNEEGDEVLRAVPDAWRISKPRNGPRVSLATAQRMAKRWAAGDERQRAAAPDLLRALQAAAAAPPTLLANARVVVRDVRADPGPRAHDAVLVDLDAAEARAVAKGAALPPHGRAIAIELLSGPAGALPNTTGLPDAFDRPGIEKLLETDLVAVYRARWQPGQRTPMHFHARDLVVAHLADGALGSIAADGAVTRLPHWNGATRFAARGRSHAEELIEGEARAVIVELK